MKRLNLLGIPLVCVALAHGSGLRNPQINMEMMGALREGNAQKVTALLGLGVSPDARDAGGATPLMYAALYADSRCMKLLLDAGADPNAANQAGATALTWAVHDPTKVRLLVASSTDVNARSKEGRTPLLIAARRNGSAEVVRMLLAKGADPAARDALGGTPLMMAAQAGDVEVLRMLAGPGADVNAQAAPLFGMPRFGLPNENFKKLPKDAKGVTALILAAANGNVECVRFLLDRGADPNLKALGMADPLNAAVWRNEPEIVRMLIEKGDDVNAREMRGATPLIVAAASDETSPETIRMLLASGADLKAKDAMGRTAMDFAARRGRTEIVRLLEQSEASAAGAEKDQRQDVRRAVEKSLALLQPSGVQFVQKGGCISCHHQSIASMAVAAARARGFRVNEEIASRQLEAAAGTFALHRETMMQSIATVPASPIVSSYALVGLAAQQYPADATTDALVLELADRQYPDGRWKFITFFENGRPPLDQGDITATAMTMRAIQLYMPPGRKQDLARRVEKAHDWLAAQTPATTQEKNMRLLGLAWMRADRATIEAAASQLLREQRPDGGWAQLTTLESDAYATGQTLFALHESGVMKTSERAYRRGVEFLLSTQGEAGDWHVKSRALGFQPYFESGIPHGQDQWISAAGGAWATLALALTAEPVQMMTMR